jgi:hypothetical protein
MSSEPSLRNLLPARGLLGVGLDHADGCQRLTRGDDFVLVGGSAETHARLQALALRMREFLHCSGRTFADLTAREFEDLARRSLGG